MDQALEKASAGPIGALSPEQRLLLLCGRTRLDASGEQALRRLLDGPLDWAQITRLSESNHISALLFHHLNAVAPGKVPADIQAGLRSRYLHLAARNLRGLGTALPILAELEKAGTPGVLWKGPALAYSLYPSPELRTFTDIDLLVRRRDVAAIRETLEAHDYLPQPRPSATDDELFGRTDEVVPMWNERLAFGIDLHWGSTGRYLSPVMDCERLWSYHRTVPIMGAQLRVLDPDWMLLALCAHGAKHGPFPWPALKWITDMEAALHNRPEEAWSQLLDLSRKFGCRRMLLLGLHLAETLLDAPLPASVDAELRADPTIPDLARPILDRLLEPQPAFFPFAERLRFDLGIRERRRDRIVYTVARTFTPTRHDAVHGTTGNRFTRVPRRLLRLIRNYLLNPARAKAFVFGRQERRPARED
jgi:hypothetical protein